GGGCGGGGEARMGAVLGGDKAAKPNTLASIRNGVAIRASRREHPSRCARRGRCGAAFVRRGGVFARGCGRPRCRSCGAARLGGDERGARNPNTRQRRRTGRRRGAEPTGGGGPRAALGGAPVP